MSRGVNRSDVVGIDPGYINFAIGKLRFTGVRYINDFTEELPVFVPTNMEKWNLRDARGIRNSRPDGGPAETYRVPHSLVHPTKINEWLATLNHFLLRADWIFQKYSPIADSDDATLLPRVTIENQCDHIKNGRYDMFRIGNACETSIHMRDLCDAGTAFGRLLTRVIGKSARKYGILSDGSLQYPERKGASVDVVRALFKALGLDGWLEFLDSVLEMGEKIDDLCDALLLALQVAMNDYEAAQKKASSGSLDYSRVDNSTYPKLLSSIRIAQDGTRITEFDFRDNEDDEEEVVVVAKPTRKRKAAPKKTTKKRKSDSSEEKKTKKKANTTKPSARKPKKRKIAEDTEEL